jgi:hypothetical protein
MYRRIFLRRLHVDPLRMKRLLQPTIRVGGPEMTAAACAHSDENAVSVKRALGRRVFEAGRLVPRRGGEGY